MRKLKVGVFGASRGRTMIGVLLDHPDAELVAVCDKYEPLLQEVGQNAEEKGLKIALYTDFEEFFKHDMDAVVLANYATEHSTYGVRLLRSGRHIMTEVLPCETPAQGVELAEAVEETGLTYAYAENYCYMDRTFEMWRRYQNGDIGRVTYGEGEYIHDCSAIWPRITYGDRNHWRNMVHPFFYNTHSLGPLLTMTGERPAKVTGIMTRFDPAYYLKGLSMMTAGIEMVTTKSGAVFKSIHGGLKREPGSINYELYGDRGCMETQRFGDPYLNVYREGDKACKGNLESYFPQKFVDVELASTVASHGGSDFYATHFFIQKILGRESGRWSIDVYQALDMGLCGLLAHRSALAGGIPMEVPDFRDPVQREPYRNDHACTTPSVAGDQLLPRLPIPEGFPEVPQEAYDQIRELWKAGKDFEN
ncbi:MAG: Gfo/Idh/MocA family oxidoreductase [Clostridiaceae bacterium]|nr:Gfo/Idh/MocA family oxidoreductase [Clostridiaceae bacterium]